MLRFFITLGPLLTKPTLKGLAMITGNISEPTASQSSSTHASPRRRLSLRTLTGLATCAALISCTVEATDDDGSGAGAGGSYATGGESATGGYATGGFGTGATVGTGAATGTGGTAGTGGFGTGATVGTGAATGTGGTAGTGGDLGTGGAETGGTGGAATGGTGGLATGGASTGGASTGGSSGTGGAPAGTKFVGNITTGNSIDAGGRTFSKHWDQITPENAGKWGSVQSTAGGGFNWGPLDAIYDYTQSKGIIFKQHVFVWGAQQPSGTPTAAQVENWIKSFCQRYPNTKLIDVVNEPPPHTTPNYVNNLGGGTNGNWAWITKSFQLARQHCPNAILILNDYNNIEWTNDNQHFIDIVKTIKQNGAPIDAVGAQAHDLDYNNNMTATMKTLLTKLHNDTNLPVYITEYDISTTDDAAQLATYQAQIPFFLETEWIKGITIWGWIYGQTWSLAPDSGLVRNNQPRPAFTWLMNQLNRPTQ